MLYWQVLDICSQSLKRRNKPLLTVFGPGGSKTFVGYKEIDRFPRDDHRNEGFEDESRNSVLAAATEQNGLSVELVDDTVERSPGDGEDS